ncbi:MAG: beta-ketoacyl-ACP synthase II [Deltaproteobacteria bacterium]|nr:beta-ketoacyl-ACP synthase II [Deltaproteobacteria bacterium]
MTSRRVVVTGLGLVTPLATGVEASWEALVRGTSGIGRITRFEDGGLQTRIAGQVNDFEPGAWMDRKDARRIDLFAQYAVAAAEMALRASGLPIGLDKPSGYEPTRVGVLIGSGVGGLASAEEGHEKALASNFGRLSPMFILKILANTASGLVSMRTGAAGPNWSPVAACSTGAHAIGEALWSVRTGRTDAMIVGSSEAAITKLGVGGFEAMRALSQRNDDPQRASRPFDRGRDGFVIGEGAGVLILEEESLARRRGAPILAEVAGYGANSDAHHLTQPTENGERAAACMRLALQDAGLAPDAINYVNAHGTSTPLNDTHETKALKLAFGEHAQDLAVSSTKSMTGHLLGAAGSVEAAFCVLSLQHGVIPPTINYDDPDPACDLDYVPNRARERQLNAVMNTSFGFGGTNAVLVFTRAENQPQESEQLQSGLAESNVAVT